VLEKQKLSPEEWSAQYVATVFYVYCKLQLSFGVR